MSSDLVIVYHREPYEEVVENGEIVRRAHKSPNGIVPTLRGFFQYFERGTWVAWTEVPGELNDMSLMFGDLSAG